MSVSADVVNVDALDAQAINNFREYLRIPSVHPNINYDGCIPFLENQAKSLELPIRVFTYFSGKPIVLITWIGLKPELPSILLNSHMDVVAVHNDGWKHEPFSAHMDEDENIYARGTQDMKSVGIQYLEAIRRLKMKGIALKRTIHVSFVPDEEIGGVEGMKAFTESQDFRDLNVGFTLDEGVTSSKEDFIIFYGERFTWKIEIHCPGQPGHGSLFMDNTAGEKVRHILDKFFDFRAQEKAKTSGPSVRGISHVTTVNLTKIEGGIQANVLPAEIIVTFDCRITPSMDIKKWEDTISLWCKEAGEGVWVKYTQKDPKTPITKVDDTNPFWVALKGATDKMNLTLTPIICPGATDARYLRNVGCPAIGFSPINKTKLLIHDHNEHLNAQIFLRGIEIYCNVITAIANV